MLRMRLAGAHCRWREEVKLAELRVAERRLVEARAAEREDPWCAEVRSRRATEEWAD